MFQTYSCSYVLEIANYKKVYVNNLKISLCKAARKKNVMGCCRKYVLGPMEVTARLRDPGKRPGSGLVSLGTSVKVGDER